MVGEEDAAFYGREVVIGVCVCDEIPRDDEERSVKRGFIFIREESPRVLTEYGVREHFHRGPP